MTAHSTQSPRRRPRSRDSIYRAGTEPPRRMRVATAGGALVSALVYEPEGPIHGNLLIHSATACPQRFYAGFAQYLTQSGLRVFTYDYRGIGESRGPSLRSESVTIADWALADARAMHAHVRAHYPGVPLAILGHSFGAQLVGLLDEAREARVAIFVGGQLGYYGFWSQPHASGLRALWKIVVPAMCRTFGYLPKQLGLGEDLPRGVALQWARWCAHPEYLMSEFPEARERYASFSRPVLSFSFSDDPYAPPRAIDALLACLTSARVLDRRLSPLELGVAAVGHFGFFRPRVGAKLWDQARDYLLAAMFEADGSELPASA